MIGTCTDDSGANSFGFTRNAAAGHRNQPVIAQTHSVRCFPIGTDCEHISRAAADPDCVVPLASMRRSTRRGPRVRAASSRYHGLFLSLGKSPGSHGAAGSRPVRVQPMGSDADRFRSQSPAGAATQSNGCDEWTATRRCCWRRCSHGCSGRCSRFESVAFGARCFARCSCRRGDWRHCRRGTSERNQPRAGCSRSRCEWRAGGNARAASSAVP